MMITPIEIENKEFSRSMRGYNAEEVDAFLDVIILDLQKLLADQEELKLQVKSLEEDLAQYKRSETSVLNTLESAKKLMNDISESAEKRAEIIVRNAQMEAESIQREARDSISKLTEEADSLKYKVTKFRERYRQMLEDQLSELDGSSEELFADLEREFDFMPASMESPAAGSEKPATGHTAVIPEKKTGPVRGTAAQTPPVRTPDSAETMVVSDRSLDDLLMENFGIKDSGDLGKTMIREDLSKTRIVR